MLLSVIIAVLLGSSVCAIARSSLRDTKANTSRALRNTKALYDDKDGTNDRSRLTGVFCYKLGRVLFKPRRYAALLRYVQWNGFEDDNSCCNNRSKKAMYCVVSNGSVKVAQVKWIRFNSLCKSGSRPLSYKVVPWNARGSKVACLLVRGPRTTHIKPSTRKLHGQDRSPKAAVYNLKNESHESIITRIQALKRLRKMRSPSGFHAISGTEQRLFTTTHRFSSGYVYTIIVNFNPLYLMEYWAWKYRVHFRLPASVIIFSHLVHWPDLPTP